MAWTYSENPSSSPKDEVRFLMGDTVQADPHVSDEEIAYLLTQYGDPHTAAAEGCQALCSKYAGLIDRTVGTLSIAYSQKSKQFCEQATNLRKQSRSPEAVTAGAAAGPLVFGIAHEEKDTKDQDLDLIPDTFDEGMHDNPGTETSQQNRLE